MSPSGKHIAAWTAALAIAAGARAALAATDTTVVVVNDSGADMVQLYVGSQQVLGGGVPPGQAVRIDANQGRGCMAVITAVFSDGSMRTSQINACQVGEINATARGLPYCPGDPRCKRAESD